MRFEAGQKVLFIGDSITDAGRRLEPPPFGRGYVSMVRNALLARYPELGLSFVNQGVSGHTVRDLAARWARDVIAERPDWLSVMIGINDVWRGFGGFRGDRNDPVPLEEFSQTLSELVSRAVTACGARLILMTPYVIEPNGSDPMRREMDRFGVAVKDLARARQAVLVDTQAAFDAVLAHTQPASWAPDRVHCEGPGHMVIALAFLRAVGFRLEA